MHSSYYDSLLDSKKDALRRKKLKEIREYKHKDEYAEKLIEWIRNHRLYKEASAILAFSPLRSEVDISPILDDERILLPYIDESGMHFTPGKGNMIRNSLGFYEPVEKRECQYEKAVMLVPLIAFDKDLNRLGRGGGYYDRYIRENRHKLYTIGICFPASLTEEVPTSPLDEPLDEIPVL